MVLLRRWTTVVLLPVSPKACGHTKGRRVVSREEAVLRIRAAADARDEGDQDIVIVARTDARQAANLAEAIWRAKAFVDQGADVVFIDALASKAEMREFCQALPDIPKMANMLEGGGKSPIMSPLELEELGFKLVAYPLSLLGVSIRAMEDALKALITGRMPPPSLLPTFDEVKEVVGFNEYYKEEERYASLPPPKPRSSSRSAASRPVDKPSSREPTVAVESKTGGSDQPNTEASRPSMGTVDQKSSGPDQPKTEAPKSKPKAAWAGPPPPSADEIAKRRTEWGLGSSPGSSSSSPQSTAQASEKPVSKSTEVVSPGVRTTGDEEEGAPAGSRADSVTRLDGTRPTEPTAAEAAMKTAEDAAAAALEEAERLIAAAEKKAGGANEGSGRKEPTAAKSVEIETADGWRDLTSDESSTSVRSEMKNLPGLRGRQIRIRILGPDGEKKLEFNVPAGFLDGLSNVVPGVAGLDLRALLEESLAQRRATTPSGAIVDVQSGADRIQIFLD
ncbi:Putative isocitrate lyase [Klebsormidium nitens]|uniref:Putative isocitrate lyase n=1 Tax=Klebsormidium nitens TaxID=105231 RepID=A0A1Y1HZA0_KLENI|nr:Putative isocitrate lyase [Klebsormidium nitens]|eukprot:GAQ83984.1 Putative isocitrate lyase [Klebsormidium nitens]